MTRSCSVLGFGLAVCCVLGCKSAGTPATDAGHAGTRSGASGSESAGKPGSAGTASAGRASSAGRAGGNSNAGKAAGGPAANSGSGGVAATSASAGTPAAGGGAAGTSTTATPATETVYVSGYGSDINVLRLDTATGLLEKNSNINGGTSPSYLALAPNKQFLYAINEADGAASKVVAFSVDQADGHLTRINSAATKGSGAPHLAVHKSGKWLVVAHYNSGHTSVLPILDNGGVGDATSVDKGPNSGCDKAHQAVFDASGEHLFVPCLGSNYVIAFSFKDGALSYADPPTIAVTGGPRHFAFDPAEKYAYVLSELESTITSFKYDAVTGKLTDPKVINSYEQTKGASAHIVVHASGQWLYASNRKENSVGLFSIDGEGRPHAVAFEKDQISTPRDFSVDPSGNWLLLANQDGAQNVLVYRIAPADGRLTRTQLAAVGGQPTFTRAVVLP